MRAIAYGHGDGKNLWDVFTAWISDVRWDTSLGKTSVLPEVGKPHYHGTVQMLMVEVKEVLPRATVSTVICQARFPMLLAIERKMPEIQLALLDVFPTLQVNYEYSVIIGDPAKLANPENVPPVIRQQASEPNKSWVFESKDGDQLQINAGSITLTSKKHTSYNQPAAPKKFRDLAQVSYSAVIANVKIPYLDRVGLRYVDSCPLEKSNEKFRRWFNVPLPIDRFALEKTDEMRIVTRTKVDDAIMILHQASFGAAEPGKLVLDYDAYQLNASTEKFLPTLDVLHEAILKEYGKDITEEFLDYMRSK